MCGLVESSSGSTGIVKLSQVGEHNGRRQLRPLYVRIFNMNELMND